MTPANFEVFFVTISQFSYNDNNKQTMLKKLRLNLCHLMRDYVKGKKWSEVEKQKIIVPLKILVKDATELNGNLNFIYVSQNLLKELIQPNPHLFDVIEDEDAFVDFLYQKNLEAFNLEDTIAENIYSRHLIHLILQQMSNQIDKQPYELSLQNLKHVFSNDKKLSQRVLNDDIMLKYGLVLGSTLFLKCLREYSYDDFINQEYYYRMALYFNTQIPRSVRNALDDATFNWIEICYNDFKTLHEYAILKNEAEFAANQNNFLLSVFKWEYAISKANTLILDPRSYSHLIINLKVKVMESLEQAARQATEIGDLIKVNLYLLKALRIGNAVQNQVTPELLPMFNECFTKIERHHSELKQQTQYQLQQVKIKSQLAHAHWKEGNILEAFQLFGMCYLDYVRIPVDLLDHESFYDALQIKNLLTFKGLKFLFDYLTSEIQKCLTKEKFMESHNLFTLGMEILNAYKANSQPNVEFKILLTLQYCEMLWLAGWKKIFNLDSQGLLFFENALSLLTQMQSLSNDPAIHREVEYISEQKNLAYKYFSHYHDQSSEKFIPAGDFLKAAQCQLKAVFWQKKACLMRTSTEDTSKLHFYKARLANSIGLMFKAAKEEQSQKNETQNSNMLFVNCLRKIYL